MDNVSRYGYINAKLRARIGAILSSSLLESMIKAPRLPDAVSLLAGTQYDCLSEVFRRTGDLQQVELEIFSREIQIQKDIIRALSGSPADFVTTLLEKSEIENIKNAIRLWYSAKVLNHSMSYRASYIFRERIVNDIDWTRIINALTWDEIASAFRDSVYAPVFQEHGGEEIQNKGLFSFEIGLDHLWFERVYAGLAHLSRADREVATRIYDVDVDLKNILNLIRYGFYHKAPSTTVEGIFIPHGSLYALLEKKMRSSQLSFADARQVVSRKYPEVGSMMMDMESKDEMGGKASGLAYDTLAIENYLARHRRRSYRRILSLDPFTIGTILSYIHLCTSTDNTIKGILEAKYYGWDEERIRRELN